MLIARVLAQRQRDLVVVGQRLFIVSVHAELVVDTKRGSDLLGNLYSPATCGMKVCSVARGQFERLEGIEVTSARISIEIRVNVDESLVLMKNYHAKN